MELEKQPVSCPVCGGDRSDILYDAKLTVNDPKALYGAASGVRGTQRIVKCRSCEMIFENPRFPEAVILEGYRQSDEAGHDSQYDMRVESFYRALKRVAQHLPPKGGSVLDIGTAGGAFLDAAKRYGYEVSGLEPSEYLVKQAKSRGLEVRCGTIDNHDFRDNCFDLITMWDVIEHVVDPKDAVKKVSKLLKKDGRLLINYPDIGTLQAKFAGERFWWILSGHLHYFTRKTITHLLEGAGFEVEYFGRYWQTLRFGYLQDVAIHLNVPFGKAFKSLTPRVVQQVPLSYYASQTMAIARLK